MVVNYSNKKVTSSSVGELRAGATWGNMITLDQMKLNPQTCNTEWINVASGKMKSHTVQFIREQRDGGHCNRGLKKTAILLGT